MKEAYCIGMTEEQAEELLRLKESEHVKLARKELRLRYKIRQQLYTLRALEKRGKELAEMGYSIDTIDKLVEEIELNEAREAAEKDGFEV